MKTTFLLLLLLLSSGLLTAQTPTPQPAPDPEQQADEPTRDGLWDGRFKGGNYIVRCSAIIALSKHEYVSDGVARVVEVNLTLNSAQVVRFYFLEPVKVESNSAVVSTGSQALERAKELVEQAAGRVSPVVIEPKVVKNYPTSTHAHTVEFVLQDENRLNAMFQSLQRGFRTGQGRIWKE